MKFEVYGKNGCPTCKSTMEKLALLIGKADGRDHVLVAYHDVETVEGMAEGAFNDVTNIPTTILRTETGEPMARWEGKLPPSVEVKAFLASAPGGPVQ